MSGGSGYPVAYCAPVRRYAAALTLICKGEQVARIVEHAGLEGSDRVVVADGPWDGKNISDKGGTDE